MTVNGIDFCEWDNAAFEDLDSYTSENTVYGYDEVGRRYSGLGTFVHGELVKVEYIEAYDE